MLQLFKDLLIHGEGGDGAGAAPGAAPGAEASGVTAPVAGEREDRKLTREERKAQRRARLEEKLAAERAQATPQQAAPQAQQEQAPTPRMFTEEEVQAAVKGRVKNLKDSSAENESLKAENERLNKLLAQLAHSQYDINPGEDGRPDIEAIEKAAGRSRIQEFAYENGTSEEYAEKAVHMQDELAEKDRRLREFEAAEAARKKSAEDFAALQKHFEQAEQFRQKMGFPSFDLLAEMERTPLFAHLLSCGASVENAYWAAHHDELMAAGQHAAATYATRALAANIQAGQSMPVEGGLGRSPAASPQRVMNFKGRSKAEREAFHKSVQRGDKHYF